MFKRSALLAVVFLAVVSSSAIADSRQDPVALQKFKEIDAAMDAAPQIAIDYHGDIYRSKTGAVDQKCKSYFDRPRSYYYSKCHFVRGLRKRRTWSAELITPTATYTKSERSKCVKKRRKTSDMAKVFDVGSWTWEPSDSARIRINGADSAKATISINDQPFEASLSFKTITNLLTKSEVSAVYLNGEDNQKYAYRYSTPKQPKIEGKRCK